MLAIISQASALSMVFSKSLARRRLRPSQAKVLSTTHRRGNRTNAKHRSNAGPYCAAGTPEATSATGSPCAPCTGSRSAPRASQSSGAGHAVCGREGAGQSLSIPCPSGRLRNAGQTAHTGASGFSPHIVFSPLLGHKRENHNTLK